MLGRWQRNRRESVTTAAGAQQHRELIFWLRREFPIDKYLLPCNCAAFGENTLHFHPTVRTSNTRSLISSIVTIMQIPRAFILCYNVCDYTAFWDRSWCSIRLHVAAAKPLGALLSSVIWLEMILTDHKMYFAVLYTIVVSLTRAQNADPDSSPAKGKQNTCL